LNFQLGKFQWKSIATYSIKLVVTISVISSLLQIGSIPVFAQSDVTVYEKGISSSWRNWSWKSTIDLKNTSVKYSDDVAISFKPNAYGALYLHTDNSVDTTQYKSIQFMLRSTDNDQKLKVIFYDSNNNEIDKTYPLSDFGGSTVAGKWKEYNIPLTKVSGTTKIKGFALQNSGNTAQETVYLDNIYLKGNSTTSTPTTPESTPTAPSSPSTPTTPTSPEVPQPTIPTTTTNVGYTVANGQILKNGSAIKLKGVNWFGFEGGTHVVHGLWLRNYKDMVTQMKTLGFNAVRVPYCPGTLKGVTPTSIDYGRNSDLQGLNSLQVMDKVLGELNNQQMYILLDQHTPDCNAISDLWYTSSYSESSWISDLKMLATRYKNLPYFIGLDLKNEPKGSATWGTGKSTDWNVAAEKAGKEILAANANLLIFVEGIQDNPTCSGNTAHFWGGNLEPVNCKGVNSDYIPANKLVFSPHVYGPDVHAQSYFSASNFPANMPTIWDTHFGFLKDKGYAVVPGEWGGKYGNGGVSSDVTWQNALVSYYKNKKICSSFYWDWNPNSGDTGGILQNDWKTPWQNKVDMLNNFYNSCN
jgi:endoglucanase